MNNNHLITMLPQIAGATFNNGIFAINSLDQFEAPSAAVKALTDTRGQKNANNSCHIMR
ncbi:hypothetical protein L1889_17810 [Paenalcaligenes niemegkensis]|nr:hypothetical protein [Paenalcaligenes niemegkensis]MCQ9618309.1 hypothetical protein [Paenalcaligenes niemegkensis]